MNFRNLKKEKKKKILVFVYYYFIFAFSFFFFCSGYKHMPSLSSFKELVDSDQTISLKKLQIFLALTQWAESVKDQSVDPAVCRIDVCMKSFLNSVQARVGTPEDKEFELQLLTYLEQYLIVCIDSLYFYSSTLLISIATILSLPWGFRLLALQELSIHKCFSKETF